MDSTEGIAVTGVGRATVEPDIATLSVGVSLSGSDIHEIRATAGDKLNAARDRLLVVGVAASDLQTDRLNVHTTFDRQRRQTTHHLNSGMRATIRDLTAAPEIVNSLFRVVGEGLELRGLSFATEDPDAGADEARTAAFADARRKAEQLAQLAGVTLGSVISIEEHASHFGGPAPMMRMAAAAEMDVPIEAGELESEVTVAVRWAIAD